MTVRCPVCGDSLTVQYRCETCRVQVDDHRYPAPDPVELVEHPERFTQEAARRRGRTKRD